jgi:hypothetical protein
VVVVAVIAVIWAVRNALLACPSRHRLLLRLAGGIVGKIKGSSFFLWFLISAIPPFIGLVAAVLYRNEYDEPHRRCPTVPQDRAVYDACARAAGPSWSSRHAGADSRARGSLTVHSDPASRRGGSLHIWLLHREG